MLSRKAGRLELELTCTRNSPYSVGWVFDTKWLLQQHPCCSYPGHFSSRNSRGNGRIELLNRHLYNAPVQYTDKCIQYKAFQTPCKLQHSLAPQVTVLLDKYPCVFLHFIERCGSNCPDYRPTFWCDLPNGCVWLTCFESFVLLEVSKGDIQVNSPDAIMIDERSGTSSGRAPRASSMCSTIAEE